MNLSVICHTRFYPVRDFDRPYQPLPSIIEFYFTNGIFPQRTVVYAVVRWTRIGLPLEHRKPCRHNIGENLRFDERNASIDSLLTVGPTRNRHCATIRSSATNVHTRLPSSTFSWITRKRYVGHRGFSRKQTTSSRCKPRGQQPQPLGPCVRPTFHTVPDGERQDLIANVDRDSCRDPRYPNRVSMSRTDGCGHADIFEFCKLYIMCW